MQTEVQDRESVTIHCPDCKRPFPCDRDRIREIVDAGMPSPRCPRCKYGRPANPTRRPARTAVEIVALAVRQLSERETILDAAVPEIVVRSWQLAPAVFGLAGFQSVYPDSNRVICEVVRMSRPTQRAVVTLPALLSKVGVKRYMLSDHGETLAARLTEPEGAGA